jgi:hypothetical protein
LIIEKIKKNIIPILFVFIIIIIIGAYFILSVNFISDEKTEDKLIFDFETASSVKPPDLYVPEEDFFIGDYVYIFETFSNVLEKNDEYNIFLSINVSINGIVVYDDFRNVTEVDWFGVSWYFYTFDWPEGRYEVNGYLLDRNSQKEDRAKTYFNLVSS